MDKKVRPVEAINLAEMAKTWFKLAWFKLFFGSKLLVYRHAAEKMCHMSFLCLKLTYHRGVAKNTLRLPETQIVLKLSKRPNTV